MLLIVLLLLLTPGASHYVWQSASAALTTINFSEDTQPGPLTSLIQNITQTYFTPLPDGARTPISTSLEGKSGTTSLVATLPQASVYALESYVPCCSTSEICNGG